MLTHPYWNTWGGAKVTFSLEDAESVILLRGLTNNTYPNYVCGMCTLTVDGREYEGVYYGDIGFLEMTAEDYTTTNVETLGIWDPDEGIIPQPELPLYKAYISSAKIYKWEPYVSWDSWPSPSSLEYLWPLQQRWNELRIPLGAGEHTASFVTGAFSTYTSDGTAFISGSYTYTLTATFTVGEWPSTTVVFS